MQDQEEAPEDRYNNLAFNLIFMSNFFLTPVTDWRLTLVLSLQGEYGAPGGRGKPGNKGKPVGFLFYHCFSNELTVMYYVLHYVPSAEPIRILQYSVTSVL